VKCLKEKIDRSGEFAHEVAMMRALKHQNIVLFMGVSEGPDGTLYVVQELVRGGSLRKVLSDATKTIDWETRLRWAQDITMALSFMHSKQALHRDLKAENVLLDNNRCKVADFGISRLAAGPQRPMGNGTLLGVIWSFSGLFDKL